MKNYVLISCCGTKLHSAAHAEELYQSPLFKKSLAYAKTLNPDGIFILSALHHLVRLDQILEPYNVCLNDYTTAERRAWADIVYSQLKEIVEINDANFIILAGKNYYSNLINHFPYYSLPLKSLPFGKRLSWLDQQLMIDESDCVKAHRFFNCLPRFMYPFNPSDLPQNGIYVFFEKGETFHGMDRVVRIGTHTGENQLRSRLQQHLVNENKDRSIFRKNIGRALLNKDEDSFLVDWNLDLTTRETRDRYADRFDFEKLTEVEKRVSVYMRDNLSFAVIELDGKENRLEKEEQLIKIFSSDPSCHPSKGWLGNYSPVEKIRKSGLWLVNGLSKENAE